MKPASLCQPKVRGLIAEGEYVLAKGPFPQRARLDAETLLLHLLQQNHPERNRAWLIAHWDHSANHATEFRALIGRRLAGEPIQYILGETEFYGIPLHVSPAVLIPRPETEHLVEKVIHWAKSQSARLPAARILDVGTGSGAIAIALAHQLPHAAVTAIDISAPALALAANNATRNMVAIRFLHGDLLAPVAHEQFDIVASNPPYIPTADRSSLSVEIRDHEPAVALFADPGPDSDGLEIYRRLIPAAFRALTPGGLIALEIGYAQSPALTALLTQSGFQNIEFLPDLQAIPRVACAVKPQASLTS
jgi:release factor glutamine methyltransferase